LAFGVFGGILFVAFLLSLGIKGKNLEAEEVDEDGDEEEGDSDVGEEEEDDDQHGRDR